MSPRGVAIPELRQQLFKAAEEVLVREGPHGVSGRAITRTAGCSTGLLYNHFGDLEEFLTELVVHRFRILAESAAQLPSRAGRNTVVDNLTAAGVSLLESQALAVAELVLARPTLRASVDARLADGEPGLPEVTGSIIDYLDAEKRLGRVLPTADPHSVALALVGTIHHVLLTGSTTDPAPLEVVERLVRSLASGITPA